MTDAEKLRHLAEWFGVLGPETYDPDVREEVQADLRRIADLLEAVCPACQGCGRVSMDQFDRPVPQPYWHSAGTGTADGPRTCPRCEGSGVIVIPHEFIGVP